MKSPSRLWPLAAILLLNACTPAPPKLRVANLGERIELGHIIYTIFDTQWLTQIGEGVSARLPQNRFFLVRLSAANSSNAPLMIPATTLTDDDGKTYDELGDGQGVPQWIGLLREVRTAEAAQGNIVFDVPPRHYRLKISDENEQQSVLVDIPLSLGNDINLTPLPGEKK
ncbi:MAG TPA: DUF4352 domain-containing protein [Bryobacteraceae bacterium]|nr:DUF4352 domain-containing protein [Bryobacteraceae bacterium]